MDTIYWITFGPRRKKPQTTNITFPGTKRDLAESILHILCIHWDAFEYGDGTAQVFDNLEQDIYSEIACYLLQKYYGAEIQPKPTPTLDEYGDDLDPERGRDEVDLYDIWNSKQAFFPGFEVNCDLAQTLLNPELRAGINHRRYRPGLAYEIHKMTLHGFENHEPCRQIYKQLGAL